MHRLTIIAQTFYSLKEITLTVVELQGENQTGVKLQGHNILIEQSPRIKRAQQIYQKNCPGFILGTSIPIFQSFHY